MISNQLMKELKMKTAIKDIRALEILDSRGNPTIRVFMESEDGTKVKSSVPSGG